MRRILLIIDDYNELVSLQTTLKKVGFDVEGLSQAKNIEDKVLSFNPQALVIATRVGRVSAAEILGQIVRKDGHPRVGLVHPEGANLNKEALKNAGINFFVQSPVNIRDLVSGMGSSLDLDVEALKLKLDKIENIRPEDENESRKPAVANDPVGETDSEVVSADDIESIKKEFENMAKEMSSADSGTDASTAETESAVKSVRQSTFDETVTEDQARARKNRFNKHLAEMEAMEESRFERDRIIKFTKWIRTQPQQPDMNEIENDRKSFVKHLFNMNKKDQS